MNTSEDEPLSGLNARLRPRRSTVTSPHTNKATRKPEPRTASERQKRTSTPSKAATTKPDDLANKSDSTNTPQLLCPYCDRKFATKQTLSQHARRVHLSKEDAQIGCLFCNHAEPDFNIIRHMVDSHPNQYFACLDCHTRFPSTPELAEHKLNVCEKPKVPYRSKLRQKVSSGAKKTQKSHNVEDKGFRNDGKDFPEGHRFNGVVIACELKPSQVNDEADIENNITTNLILPPSKSLGSSSSMEKNAVIVLDDIQWNKRMPTNFSFHNTDADQILSRLGVVHRSPRTAESTKKDWFKCAEEATQKFEKCFDTSFYSKVASNVHENMSKFLDGSFNFNPDPDSIIKTRKSKNSVPINAAEGFPILLAFEQYSRNVFDGYMPRALAPKHKWKWENEKAPLNPDDIKHDTHVNNCIITLVSSLDIWTQLCMRRKFEEKFSIAPLEKKTEKRNAISKELKEILESRELPSSSQQVVKFMNKPMPSGDSLDFPATLGLRPSAPTYDVQPAVLSGEWVRPRCYVCCACGAQTRDSRGLSSHISTQHPNAQVQHYEIVGELLLNADILKHLYVPPSQLSNRTRPLRGFRECTKCKKSISLEDLHQHMLDCAGDTPAVRRKCRYRPFGVRRRRTRLPDNTIRKKIRKDIRTRQTRQKAHMRSRPKIRSEVGDAETIRKMLADLPAKRHRVMVNPLNPMLRPRRKLDQQRNKLIMKRRSTEMLKNRKQRSLRNRLRTGSNSGDNDDNDIRSHSKSDDDNKPLKPQVKTLKIKRCTRQTEALKRKVALNRAKRRAQIKEQKATEDKPEEAAEAPTNSSVGQGDQLSIDNSSQRIDVSGGPYNTREHSSRGRSNHRDDQRAGPSSQDGNTHKTYTPPQNAPLKHSIARLTADSDMHDKNMQFHHLYLMPPECNEATQHVPTGQQPLFENEAVVTKLDKPPLHFSPTGPVDPFACQKSKQCSTSSNKRKGLNDCIAMLKNKAGQVTETETPEAAPCNSEDQLTSNTAVTNQISPNPDFQMNVNYEPNTRPAEIFLRHQFIPDTFIEYRPESNLIAQNFADLPFHYLTNQRLPFDLPQPYTTVDPRFIRPPKPKQNEGAPKTTRRRSTRAEKDQMKRQDYELRTSPAHFAVNVSTPSRVGGPQSRRASSTAAISTNTAVNKRRASVSHNRSQKTINDYRTEAMLTHQRPLDYFQHQVSSEARLIELNQTEAYLEAQKNIQKQIIDRAEEYMNKKQLAISVNTNYANKKPNTLSPEAVYLASKQAISPGSNYINKKQAAVGVDGSHVSKHKHSQETSTVESNYMKQKQALNAKETDHFSKMPAATNTEIAYNKAHAAESLDTGLISKVQAAAYIESAYINKKAQAMAAENNSLNKGNKVVCNESYLKKSPVIDIETNSINRTQPLPLTENNCSPVAQSISVTNIVATKQKSVATETNLTPITSPVTPEETNFISKKRMATSDVQLSASDSPITNKKPAASAEVSFVDKKHVAASDTLFVNKKQAVALENNFDKKQAATPQRDLTINKTVPSSESNFISNTQRRPTTDSNISDKKSPVVLEEVYPESAFKNFPANIPSAYPTMDNNYQSSSSVIEAPLDLSKSTSKENAEMSGKDDDLYDTDSFDNYETLDLSHKSSEHDMTEHDNDEINDEVVDLRVKVNTPTLDMSSNLPCDDHMDSATDLSTRMRDDDSPKDLTVKKKANDNAYEHDSLNVNYGEVQEFVQDLRKTQPEEQAIALSSNINDSNTPTDLSERSRDVPGHKVAPKPLIVKTHMDNMIERVGSPMPTDFSMREKPNQNTLPVTPKQNSRAMISPVINKQHHQSKKNNVVDGVHPNIIDESPYTTKAVYDCSINQPLHTTPKTASMAATVQCSIDGGTDKFSNAVRKSCATLPENKPTEDGTAYNLSVVATATVSIHCSSITKTIPIAAPSVQLYTTSVATVPLSTSKFTTPVYTSANTCESMTRIGSLNTVPLSEAALTIPQNITTASAASIYTLTDTTVNPTVQHVHDFNQSSQDALCTTVQSICNSQIATDTTLLCCTDPNLGTDQKMSMSPGLQITKSSAQEQNKDVITERGELDPETAKKIAMLPKELGEILGTMPVDHRNQLLNVLPQYVSTPAVPFQNELAHNLEATTTATSNKIVSPLRQTDFDVKPTLPYSPVSSSQSLRSLSIHPVSASAASVDKAVEMNLRPHYQTSGESVPPDAEVGKRLALLTRVYEVDGNTVIDLTEDESANVDVKNIVEPNNSDLIPSNEVGAIDPNTLMNKQKNNDKTASLRAVRIKAPSKRNKSLSVDNNTVLKITCQEPNTKSKELNISNVNTNVDKTNDLDKTLAIQQAEISSTQHNTSAGHCKYPLAISPSSTEYSGDESSKPVTQPSPLPISEIVSKNIEETKYETPMPKTGMVTSSIPTNVVNCSNAENNINTVIDTNTPDLAKSLEVANNDSILISEGKEFDSLNYGGTVPDAAESGPVVNTTPCNVGIESEEDSEDGMSLAAIIQQKQRNQEKTCEITISNKNTKKQTNKKKKKERKAKKGTQNSDKIVDDILFNELDSTPDDCAKSLEKHKTNDLSDQLNDSPENIEPDKHSKKQPRRSRRPAISSGAVLQDKVPTIETDKEINKENDAVPEFVNNNTAKDHTTQASVKSAIKESSLCGHDVVESENLQIEASDIKSKSTDNNDTMLEKDAVIRVSKLSVDSSIMTNKGQNKPKGKNRLEISEAVADKSVKQGVAEETFKAASELNQDIGRACIETKDLTPQVESLEQGSDSNDVLNSVEKKGKKPARVKKQKHLKAAAIALEREKPPQNVIEDKEDIKTPVSLRRSTRGKSLYLENSVTDLDLCEPDQKTHLTKKQLILSKLRLDEDTPKPSAHSTPEKHNISENELQNVNSKQGIDDPESGRVENSCEIFDEIPKGKKRRISSQISLISKKKKPIEEQNKIIKETDTEISKNIRQDNKNLTDKKLTESLDEFNVISNEKPQSPELSNDKNMTDTNAISTEKRKINNQISFDLSQSSKPKKSKISKNIKNLDKDLTDLNTNKDNNTTSILPETKTACYNVQVPTRRLRSKSTADESAESNDYDPYDINLEVMAEQNESGKKSQSAGKNNKKKAANSNIKESCTLKKDNRKQNKTLDIQQDTKVVSDYDSDDSTKSDVPLQKYIEEKERKTKNMEVISKEKELSYKEIISKDEERRRSSDSDKIEDSVTQDDKDEQAEKFMQSFGFFSEKKHRKSNILASKKISETINITNESDDRYFGFKGRSSKKNADNKKIESESSKTQPQPSTSKKAAAKRGRKKKGFPERKSMVPRACETCRKNFKRSDLYLRHILSSLYHISKTPKEESKMKTQPFKDGPSSLVAYKVNLERYRNLIARHAELKNRSAKAAARITLPTHAEFIKDVNETVAELQVLATRALSQDEALFLNCCELLKGTYTGSFLDNFEKSLNEEYAKLQECCDDDDVDSITAKNILESEEVRNLENDLISGLREAALASRDSKTIQEKANDAAQSLIEISQVAIPQAALQVAIPQAETPQTAIPHDETPQMLMPQVELPEMSVLLQDSISEVPMPDVTMPEPKISEAATPLIAIPQMALPEEAPLSPAVPIEQVPPKNAVKKYPEQTREDCDVPDMRQKSDVKEIQEESPESQTKESREQFSSPVLDDESMDEFDVPIKCKVTKAKKPMQVKEKHIEVKERYIEVKEKMYPDIIEDIDMFEDKFDKIKRKCRSQAAAAKQLQPVVEPPSSNKGRRKSEKKKGKRVSKKNVQQNSQVPTKGALKGFDGIKVSIPTSDINLSAIVPAYESSAKKKKKSGSKKKRDKKDSESSEKYDSDHRAKDSSINKKVDVYEFMDNEDAELFEFRPSTLMERFKSISNKDMQSTSKGNTVVEDDISSDSASDGDDFVYMSDDYVCSDDETENSIMSCEIGSAKIGNDVKKISPQKRKDTIEKNAVMGKIFKHNALRTEKKIPVVKEAEKPKANLDQLFDSLLEDEPNSSVLNSDAMSPKDDEDKDLSTKHNTKSSKYDTNIASLEDQTSIGDSFISSQDPYSFSPEDSDMILSGAVPKRRNSSPLKEGTSKKHDSRRSSKNDPSKKYDPTTEVNYGASTSKQYVPIIDDGPSTSKKYGNTSPKDYKDLSPKRYDPTSINKYEDKSKHHEPKSKKRNNSSSHKRDDGACHSSDEDPKSPASKLDEGISTSYDFNTETYDPSVDDEDTGVARHRARRKCTVGKQNVLTEIWSSSESEPDGGPPRPNSAESVLSCMGRKRKGRKKDGPGGRRGNSRQYRKQDFESRVSNRVACASVAPVSVGFRRGSVGSESVSEPVAGTSTSDMSAAAMPAPSTSSGAGGAGRGRRAGAHYWAQQEDQQQHGWIVCNSHKKLVTMLAHAKGRNRSDDDSPAEE